MRINGAKLSKTVRINGYFPLRNVRNRLVFMWADGSVALLRCLIPEHKSLFWASQLWSGNNTLRIEVTNINIVDRIGLRAAHRRHYCH